MVDIYPSFTFTFLIFNLLGWWFKGQPFFSWWWFLVIYSVQIVMQSIMLALANKMIEMRR